MGFPATAGGRGAATATTRTASIVGLWAKPPRNDADVDEEEEWEPDEEDLLSELEEMGDDITGIEEEDELNGGLLAEDDEDEDDPDAVDEDEFDEDDDDAPPRKRRGRRVARDDDDDDEDDDEFQLDSEDDIWADEEDEEDGEWNDENGDEYEYVYNDDGDAPGVDDELGEEALQELLSDPDFDDIPLEDDPDDPEYTAKLKTVQETVDRRVAKAADEDFDALDYIQNRMTPLEMEIMDSFEVNQQAEKEGHEYIDSVIDISDFENMDVEAELAKTTDLYDDDPHIETNVTNFMGTGVTDEDVASLDRLWKETKVVMAAENWNKVDEKAQHFNFEELDNTTQFEFETVDTNIEGSPYNHTKWLIYDLDFNVSNLMLAACKHNPDAPVILSHWLDQLEVYERYQHVRDRNFDFTWEDVERADVDELRRYYKGFGYDEIPNKAPAETGIINFSELDEEELKMVAYERWMNEVYNENWDVKDFDDDSIVDEDNVFSDNFEMPDPPDKPTMQDAEDDWQEWQESIEEDYHNVLEEGGEAADEVRRYRDMIIDKVKYKLSDDNKDFQEKFRGHVVIACGNFERDLDMAEAITIRFEEEFGNQVYVETRLIMHAREDDYVFEVWLESYEIDLIHSRRRNFLGSHGWEGPGDVDSKQLDYLVEEVRTLISDECRYSYRMTDMDLQTN
jgi:hypothetical protein